MEGARDHGTDHEMRKDEMGTVVTMAHYLRLRFVATVIGLFSAIYFYDAILVHVLEDVRRVHENADGARGRHYEEDVKLESIDHHCHVFPILPCL